VSNRNDLRRRSFLEWQDNGTEHKNGRTINMNRWQVKSEICGEVNGKERS
jgi:hypothetical protein